jgi:hypothetical protein
MLHSPFIVPVAAFVMVVIIVAIGSYKKMRERELQAHLELRQREMEHGRQLKQMEIEKAKLEVEKARANKGS